ncbi:2TM domain-containing protein [Chryseobacterium sp. WG14]|uniref:2TM domain-containing protein n=1 Tax=Chryseobacterium sp. WG14 TaxID=2926909 RepID=UPI00211DE885|nr:2TM domain-containing protein [Chryseobacterium sp. WG14]MCQ9641361.1 2TM domain-containing protein [Chryseobacterium sp. WG14]
MDYNTAYERVNKIRKFYKSLLWFGIIAGIILFNDFLKDHFVGINLFSGHIFLVIWAVILTVKAVKLFVFDAEWEKELIEKELGKNKKPIDF